MNKKQFFIVDVFAENKYAGNQLAVVLDAGDLSGEQMLDIAREMNYSETTFVLSDEQRDGGYDVRIFTPGAEVPFAGHPTLGTAYVIRDQIIKEAVDTLQLNLGVGQIPVTFVQQKDGETLWMKQKSPDFGQTVNTAEIGAVLGLDEAQIDSRFPVQEVSTGLWFLIVPLASLDAVKRAHVIKDKYTSFMKDKRAVAILVFCPETYSQDNHLNVRVFVPCYGIEEDPATGSGNGCLAAYLVQHSYLGSGNVDIRVEQGYQIARPSLLYLRASGAGEQIDVHVGGKVVMVAEGRLV
jgi:trans-2,3-dihydro-3-hydroxyanthranilate isomerase